MKYISHKLKMFVNKQREIGIILLFLVLVGGFFYRTLLYGKLPVPSDALVGLYHPYRDQLASDYPNGLPFKNFLITDPVRQQIPWRKSAVTAIREGRLPLWDPFSFSGTPLLANIQSGAFYPLNILFLILPFEVAWTCLIISQPLLAGLFLYLFLRRKNLDPASCLFGALCFAFSGFSIAWLTWGTLISTWLWTPLSMLVIDTIGQANRKRKLIWVLIGVFALASSLLAGHIQIFFYSVLFLIFYAISSHREGRSKKAIGIYLCIALGVLSITSRQWLALLEWLPNTGRLMQGSEWKLEGFFIPLWHLVQFIVPDFFGNPATLNYWGTWNYGEMVGYIGVAGLFLALVGISAQTLFWVWGIVIALLLSLASPLSSLPYQLHIPILSSLQPTRLLVVIDFCLSILAAYGFSELIKGISKKTLFKIFFLIGSFFAIVWISVFMPTIFGITQDQALVAKRNIILPFILFGCSFAIMLSTLFTRVQKSNLFMHLAAGSIIILLVIDLFRFGWKFTPFTSHTYFFPQTRILSFLQKQAKPFRIITTDDRILPPNVNEYYEVESVSGYDPIHSQRYEEFMAAMERGKPDISPPFGFGRIIAPKNIQSPLLKLLNVRYVLSFDHLEDSRLRSVVTEGNTIVYERVDWMPRFYLVERAVYKNNKQDIINELYDPGFDPTVTAVVEYPLPTSSLPMDAMETVEVLSYKSDQVTLQVHTQQPRLLVAGNIYDKNWKVFIDKAPVSVYRTNYLFMGVVVPQGSHTVTFRYQ